MDAIERAKQLIKDSKPSNLFASLQELDLAKPTSAELKFGDSNLFDHRYGKLKTMPISNVDWRTMTGLFDYIEFKTVGAGDSFDFEDHISVIPTARFIVESLWGKIKIMRRFSTPSGDIKFDNLNLTQKWYALFMSVDVQILWLNDFVDRKPVEIFRTFNHKTKEVNVYFGKPYVNKADDIKLSLSVKAFAPNMKVKDNIIESIYFKDYDKRFYCTPTNGDKIDVEFCNDACYKYGIGYLKMPYTKGGGKKLNSVVTINTL